MSSVSKSAVSAASVYLLDIGNSGVGNCLQCSGQLITSARGLVDTRFGIGGEYETRICSTCELEITFPIPEPRKLKKLYERYYNFAGRKNELYLKFRSWFFASGFYRVWLSVDGDISFYTREGAGRLLDVGCNEGRGLGIYSRNGYRAEGLELNDIAADLARKAGFSVHSGLLDTFRPRELFDVVVLSNVLEHSLDPMRMLAGVRQVLRPGGQIWISCPNSKSWFRQLFGSKWINWHVPFHIFHFSRRSVTRLLDATGYTAVKVKDESPSLWIASSIITALFARKGKTTVQLRNPFLVLGLMCAVRLLLFPFLAIANCLRRGDCLVVSAVSTSRMPSIQDDNASES